MPSICPPNSCVSLPIRKTPNLIASFHRYARPSVILQHAFYEVAHRSPEVLATGVQAVLVDEKHVVLEAGVEVWLKAELEDDRVVVAVDVGVDAV